MPRPIVPTRKPGQTYSEAELEAMEGNPEKTREYFINVAFNARRLCMQHYLAGNMDNATHMVNYSEAILEHLDVLVSPTSTTESNAKVLNKAMADKRDQQRRNRRVP